MYLLLIGLFYLLYFLYLKSNQENNNNTATTQKKTKKMFNVLKVCLGSAGPFSDSSEDQPVYQMDCLSRTGTSQ